MLQRLNAISLALVFSLLAVSLAHAQSAKDLIGAWTIVSVDNIQPDGSRRQNFGANPVGLLIFDSEGRYSVQLCRANRTRFASGNRLQGTAEENKDAVHGCNPHWGRYSVNESDRTITFNIEHALFTNWEGAVQKRPFTVTGNQLKWTVPGATTGGTAETVWERAK
jgi:hypothetical protein